MEYEHRRVWVCWIWMEEALKRCKNRGFGQVTHIWPSRVAPLAQWHGHTTRRAHSRGESDAVKGSRISDDRFFTHDIGVCSATGSMSMGTQLDTPEARVSSGVVKWLKWLRTSDDDWSALTILGCELRRASKIWMGEALKRCKKRGVRTANSLPIFG
jgi:hypothetical protein